MTHFPQRLLHEALARSAAAAPEKTAVVVEGKRYSYARLWQDAQRLAAVLRARGVRRGERVAIYMDNSWPCVVAIYAALLAGGVFLVINPQTKADKLEFILDDSDAAALLTDAHLAEVFLPVLPKCAKLRVRIVSGSLPAGAAALEAFEQVLAAAPALDPVMVNPLDLAALIYTSGSTGQPKGVMQTHQSMVFTVGSLIQYLRESADDRIVCLLPLAFDYGLYQLLMATQLGGTLVLERSFTYPAQVFQRMEGERVTVFPGVPTIFAMLLAAHQRSRLRFPHVTRVTNTAAALPDDHVARLREVFPNALIYKMYGLTECKRVCYLEPELVDAKPGSVGKAIPGTEVYLKTPEGEAVAPGGTGILYVRGPHVMRGYWKRPDLTDHMLKPGLLPGERVLCTHDYFRIDEDGFLYFVGRSDDIIKTRGEKVSPVEVENVLHAIPGVREAAVIGIPDPVLGQAVRAYVVLQPGAELGERQIRAWCQAHLENFMVPKEVVVRDDLPKTSTGKVSKKLLAEDREA
jgi:long-chain acyl-CoA synthetase